MALTEIFWYGLYPWENDDKTCTAEQMYAVPLLKSISKFLDCIFFSPNKQDECKVAFYLLFKKL